MKSNMHEQIDQLINSMTIREKLGQLIQMETAFPDRAEALRDMVRRGEVGSILMSVNATAGNTPQGKIDVNFYNDLQRIAMEESRLGIPLVYGRDVIHGHHTVYPIPLAMAAAFDPDLVRDCYREIAEEAANDSVHWSFAPMLDLARDPRWGRMIEGCGEDPFIGSEMARAVVAGFQGGDIAEPNSIAACAKHFVGYGAAEGGRDYCHAEIADYTLYNYYLPAFKAAIDAGAVTVMSSFNDINGDPVTASHYYLTTILRKYLGFDGMVVSDYAAIRQLIRNGVAEDEADAAALALTAGVDMDMVDQCYLNEGEKLVNEGRISMEIINQAVRNVLRFKLQLGLFDQPYCTKHEIDYAAHRKSARTLASKSMVLLKNENNILPLKKNARLLLIGSGAIERRSLHGSWSLDGHPEETPTLLEAMTSAMNGQGHIDYDECCDRCLSDHDTVVVALCEHHLHSGENACVSHISISDAERTLLKRARALGKKLVGVFFYGRPIAMEGIAEEFDAILYAWHSGCEAATAAADLLFGDAVPSGSLPVTMPRRATHLPLYYNCYSSGHDVNSYYGEYLPGCYIDSVAAPYYPFGYGLSYTSFAHSSITVHTNTLTMADLADGKTFTLQLSVTNAGNFDAEETVQLYICDPVAKISRPLRELKAFQKKKINQGDTAQFVFDLGSKDLGYFNPKGEYVIEPGRFDVFIGRDCLNTQQVSIQLLP